MMNRVLEIQPNSGMPEGGREYIGYIMKDMRLERQPNIALLDGGSRNEVVMIYGLGDLIDN